MYTFNVFLYLSVFLSICLSVCSSEIFLSIHVWLMLSFYTLFNFPCDAEPLTFKCQYKYVFVRSYGLGLCKHVWTFFCAYCLNVCPYDILSDETSNRGPWHCSCEKSLNSPGLWELIRCYFQFHIWFSITSIDSCYLDLSVCLQIGSRSQWG